MLRSVAALALLAVSGVHAHATFQQMWVNGVDQGSKCVRPPASNSPVSSLTTNDLACNVNGGTPASGVCAVKAGDKVSVEMHQQPGDRSCTTEAIGGNHDGPTIVYMAKVSDVKTTTPWTASWFKVAQTGLVSKDYWGTDVMNANCGKVDFTVPANLAPGNYLVRAEVIALHVASSVGGAQLYMSCYQITVDGSGSASPAGVSFPGAYKSNDPGILFDLYGSYSSYTVPGPAVYGGGSSGGAQPGTTAAGTTAVGTTAPPAQTTAPSGGSGGGATIPKYGQCGGQGWSGSTNCAAGSTCTKQNDYYSQCM